MKPTDQPGSPPRLAPASQIDVSAVVDPRAAAALERERDVQTAAHEAAERTIERLRDDIDAAAKEVD